MNDIEKTQENILFITNKLDFLIKENLELKQKIKWLELQMGWRMDNSPDMNDIESYEDKHGV